MKHCGNLAACLQPAGNSFSRNQRHRDKLCVSATHQEGIARNKKHTDNSIFNFLIFSHSVIVSVVCPTGPHPPLRLARRPNRGHIGGGAGPPPAVHAYDAFIASGFSTSILVNSEADEPRHYVLTKSGEVASNFSRNEGEKKTQFVVARTHDLKLEKFYVDTN